jgi:hypothetical protein
MSELDANRELLTILPPLYAQDGFGDDAIAYIKLSHPDIDWLWFVTEWDSEDTMFGLVFGFEKELGYISLSELIGSNVQIDLSFVPASLKAIKLTYQEFGI